MLSIWGLEKIVWEKASSSFKPDAKLSHKRHKKFKDKFDMIEDILKLFENLIQITLGNLSFMRVNLECSLDELQKFIDTYKGGKNNLVQKMSDIFNKYQSSFEHDISRSLSTIEPFFKNVCYVMYFYKFFVESPRAAQNNFIVKHQLPT